ncbi:MAG TPA: two-component regulator propeller domain-containing protein, partial [Puia sp.]|nr:two-component regulator propeller domain-containing protein [Puia sp.]
AIKSICQDIRGQYWVGTFFGGLYLFDPASGIFTQIPLINNAEVVFSITEWSDQFGLDWIVVGTDAGVVLVDPVSKKNKIYNNKFENLHGNFFGGSNTNCVFVDRQNILWIGSDDGISYVQPTKQFFEFWSIFNQNDNSRQSIIDFPYAFAENGEGIWISTMLSSGILSYDRTGTMRQKIILNYHNSSAPQTEPDSLKPYDLRIEDQNSLWFSTDYLMVSMDLKSGKKKLYKPPDGQEGTGLRSIIPYDKHNWWIRTRNDGGNGIYVFDPVAGQFKYHFKYAVDCKGCPPICIMDLMITRKKQIFLTSRYDGLFKFDSSSNQFIQQLKFEGDQLPIHSNGFDCMAEDDQGLIWIGTFKGLIAYDPSSGILAKDYSGNKLIGGMDISAICFDEEKNLWMSTQRGIFCILANSGEIRNFTHEDGLPNDLAEGFLKLGSDHFIYFG